jgi:ribosomal protein S14
MEYLVAKDKKRRKSFETSESKRLLLKSLIVNQFLDKRVRNNCKNRLSKLPGYYTQINNRCIYSGRARAIIKDFRVSRMFFKKLASFGYLRGVKKRSW